MLQFICSGTLSGIDFSDSGNSSIHVLKIHLSVVYASFSKSVIGIHTLVD